MGNPFGNGKGGQTSAAIKGHDFVKDPTSPSGVGGRDFLSNPPTAGTAPRDPMLAEANAKPDPEEDIDQKSAAPSRFPTREGQGPDVGVGSVGNTSKPFKLTGAGASASDIPKRK